jgi:nicotinamide mononucleotide (NMN) deamidase PncC
MPPEAFENYRGTTPELIARQAEALRQRLDATWCIAESGVAGPTGNRPGRTVIGIAGPVSRTEELETGLSDREGNMAAFATATLKVLRDSLNAAGR